jgi:hypothetical protein
MINEETILKSFINKTYLKTKFVSEEFNLFITELNDDQIGNATIYIKQIKPKKREEILEDGEI